MRRGAVPALLVLASLALLPARPARAGVPAAAVNWALDRLLAGRSGVRVRVGGVGLGWGALTLRDVVILPAEGGARPPLLSADKLTFRFDPWPLLKSGSGAWPRVPRLIRVQGLRLSLRRGPDGGWNWSLPSPASPRPVSGTAGPRPASPAAAPSAASRPSAPSIGRLLGPLRLPACRLELEDCMLVFDDERKGFHTVVDQLRGLADARDPRRLRFSLSGRTQGRDARDLALSGVWNLPAASGHARLDLDGVPLAAYLNYLLPQGGPRFTQGSASLDLRLDARRGRPLAVSGRAALRGGSLTLPGVRVPLEGLDGRLDFDADTLRFQNVRARFLGSDWTAGGTITDRSGPRADLRLDDPALPLDALTRQVVGLRALDLSGTASVSASLGGPLGRPRLDAVLSIPRASVRGVDLDGLQARAVWSGRRLDVERVSASLWGGQVAGSVSLDFAGRGSLRADLAVTGALLQLAGVDGRVLPLAGLADGRASLRGALDASPGGDWALSVDRLRVGALDFGPVRAGGAFTGRRFDARVESRSGSLAGRVAWSREPGLGPVFGDGSGLSLDGLPLSATARSFGLLSPWIPCSPSQARFWDRWAGRLGGAWSVSLTAQGPLDDPRLRLDTRLKRGRLDLGPGPGRALALAWQGSLGLERGELVCGRAGVPFDARLGGPKSGLRLEALGSYPLRGRSRNGPGPRPGLRLDAAADLGFLDAFGFVRDARGRLRADLTVTGSAGAPDLEGGLAVRGFSCLPRSILAPIKAGSLEARFKGSSLRLVGLSFRAPGLVDVGGELDFGRSLLSPGGRLELSTDASGLGIVDWPGVGKGSLVLSPLDLGAAGPGGPLRVSGRVLLREAHIVYSGSGTPGGSGAGKPASRRPLELNLAVALGPGVWYDRRQSKGLDLGDPAHWFLESARKSLLEPDVSLRFEPTARDVTVRGTVPDVDLSGELFVDRGWVTVMQNDFLLGGSQGPTRIRLEGARADVSGTAAVNLSYSRLDPYTGRSVEHEVQALAVLSPRDDAAAAASPSFLNFQLRFDSNPPIIQGDPDRQQTAALNLVLLGDPVVDIGGDNSGILNGGGTLGAQQAQDSSSLLASAGLGAVTTGLARQELAALLGRFEVPGASWLDVFRLAPRIRYQMGAGAAPLSVPGSAAGVQSLAGSAQQGASVDWTLELGKNIGRRLYATLQGMSFGEADRESVLVASQSDQAVSDYGVRAGFEYHLAAYRELDAYGDYGCDDDLNPVAYPSSWAMPSPSWLVQLRTTLPAGNYGFQTSRSRRFDGNDGGRWDP